VETVEPSALWGTLLVETGAEGQGRAASAEVTTPPSSTEPWIVIGISFVGAVGAIVMFVAVAVT
jgi:hypothetical protein